MTFWGYPRTLDRNNSLTGNPAVRATCLVLALGVALLSGVSPAEAAISPAGCNANGVNLDIQQNPTGTITNGTSVLYTARLSNGPFPPNCDAINLVVKGFCPDHSGIPTILSVTFPTIATLPVGTAAFTVGTWSCVVSVDTGVTSAQAQDTLSGNLQIALTDNLFSETKTVSVNLVSTPPPPPPPPPDQIPTLSEWVMIMLAAFLALVGVAALRRKRIA